MDTHLLVYVSPKNYLSKEQSISKNSEITNLNERSAKSNIIIPSIKKNSKCKYLNKYEKEKSLYLKQYKNYFHKKLVIKYNILPNEYKLMKIDNFITAKYCRDLAIFKENLIFNYDEEFLKRYYLMKESVKKIPLFSDFYKSYLTFFCTPTLTELALNDLIEEMVEKKAKVFYKENFKEEDEKSKSKMINTVIFTNKIRSEISRKNTLTNLTKTTINNNVTNKSSKSLLTIGIIYNELNTDNNKKNNNSSYPEKNNDNKKTDANEINSNSTKTNSIINKKKIKNNLYEMSEKLNVNKSKKLLKEFKINKDTENNNNIYENNINIININSNNNKINIINAGEDIIHKNYISNNNNENNIFNEIPKNRNSIAQAIKTMNKVKQQQNINPIIKFNSKLLRHPTDISAPLSERIFTSIKPSTKLGGSSSNNKNQNFFNIKHPLSILSSYTSGAKYCTGQIQKIKCNHSKSSYSNKNKKIIETNKKKKPITSRNNQSSFGAIKSITNGSEILNNINNTSRIMKKFATTVSFQVKSLPKNKNNNNSNNKISNKMKERNTDSGNKNNEVCYYKKLNNKVIIRNSKIIDNKKKNYNLKSINNAKCMSSNKLILSSYNKSQINSMTKTDLKNNKTKIIDYQNYGKINNTIVSDSKKVFKKIKKISKNKK